MKSLHFFLCYSLCFLYFFGFGDMSEMSMMVEEYAKHPVKNYPMENCTISQHEGNFICEDNITVYLVIQDNIIRDWSFDGDCSTITTAASSFFSELVIGKPLEEVLTWNFQTIKSAGFEVSNRRKRASVIALLATRNAIHEWLKDGKKDDFDDLFDD